MGLNSLTVTRFPNGVNNQPENSIFGGSCPFPGALDHALFDDDFYEFFTSQWTVTETQAGATQALLNPGDGGLVALVNTAADNDLNSIQRVAAGVTGESWTLIPTKKTWGRFRVGIDSVLLCDFVAGLMITDTTPLAVSDGLFFRKPEASAVISLVSCKNGTESLLTVGNAIAATVAVTGLQTNFMNLDFFWDGGGLTDGRLYGALNGVIGGFSQPGVASFNDDEAMTICFAVQNNTAVARTMWCDRALIIQER
jgi:hypothetical protein